ncbi:hypothetical protein ACFC09_17280 [Streptomyces sp. NPDC056161]|uniref:hypothetical protein n=1 Tax=Streptomyces sp. NPDC056161 TaxID=3345732 RepID=UPI0035D552ED
MKDDFHERTPDMPTPSSSQEEFAVPVRRISWGSRGPNSNDDTFSLEELGTVPVPGRLSRPGTVVFQDDQKRQFAFTPVDVKSHQATVSVNDGNGGWVSLDGVKADLKRFGEFIQKNRSPITTGVKVLGFGLVAAGAVVKDNGAPVTGESLQDAGNYVNNATAASDIFHYLNSAIKTIKENGLTWGVAKDLTKAVLQTGSLGVGFAGIALKDNDTLTEAATPIVAAAAAVATGPTAQEEMKKTKRDIMGEHPEAFLEGGRLREARSMTLGGHTDSDSVSYVPRSGDMSRVGSGMTDGTSRSTGSDPSPGLQPARRTTFNRTLEPTPEVPETQNQAPIPTNPISSAYNPGRPDSLASMSALSRDRSKTFAPSGSASTTGRPAAQRNHSASETARAKSPGR